MAFLFILIAIIFLSLPMVGLIVGIIQGVNLISEWELNNEGAGLIDGR